ncbi:homocysteine S-methyltransferase [Marinobacterium zhoushanense]|uniref:Homocysteine S-methyltransferase n=1 Tax=Marinobacterium zhoushanense TaxID=1679163 RepID=A0ABQ1KNF9_9GAMM|nr:homocysteine S-methyltransferase family protein [Marinobacterium zhoushanense]GGC01524.1 homocysteine S-methyltransferase [Marinobacterium zhoushanense]
MNTNRTELLQSKLFLTDGGIETTLIFHDGFELPYFAAFTLLDNERGQQALIDYYEKYLPIAVHSRTGFILESPTWRAQGDWAEKLGYDTAAITRVNRQAIEMMKRLRLAYEQPESPIVISGCIGPRGDGYVADTRMTPAESGFYHLTQIESLTQAGADMVTGLTMTYSDEAIGIALAAKSVGIPVVISFTTETDGHLPSGEALSAAINRVDDLTDRAPLYYMINCAHPDHFRDALNKGESWVQRVKGVRANASRLSHAELDQCETLDDGDPHELGRLYQGLRESFPQFSILGGCCGTDHRHIEQISHCCVHGQDVAA